jgi:hypothetical protein
MIIEISNGRRKSGSRRTLKRARDTKILAGVSSAEGLSESRWESAKVTKVANVTYLHTRVSEKVTPHLFHTHCKGCKSPGKRVSCIEKSEFSERGHFNPSDFSDELCEWFFPRVEFYDFYSTEDLIQQLDAGVLLGHLVNLRDDRDSFSPA